MIVGTQSSSRLRQIAAVVAAVVIFFWLFVGSTKTGVQSWKKAKAGGASGDTRSRLNGEQLDTWKKPDTFRVVGLIFYGRREYVSILDCYLKRNLVSNGGMLDEVLFIVRTEVEQDLLYLDELVQTAPEYTKYQMADGRGRNYTDAWSMVEPNTMYVKIDDDVVFIEDNAIPAIVQRKHENPNYFLVSANSLNQPALTWVHYHLNTAHPYLPELTPPEHFDPKAKSNSWRPSELPQWTGPEGYNITENDEAPFQGHRWLPLPKGSDIVETPMGIVDYSKRGAGWHSWVVGAQTHYSFFENLEAGELWRYKFDLWDYHYERISLNFVAVWGDDIISVMPIGRDDEGYLTEKMPRKLKRHAVLDGRGLSVHFGFHKQIGSLKGHALHWTDALERYRAYSEEMVCGKPRGTPMSPQ